MALPHEFTIYPGRSADVGETEGMSAPTGERDDLITGKLWKHQTDYFLDVRITTLGSSNIHRKPEAALLSHERERRRNTSKPTPSPLSLCGFM